MHCDMKRPCPQCPFRTDIPGYLTGVRAREFTSSLLRDESFPCHKTVEYDDEGEPQRGGDEQHCAGALILMERLDRPNQWMRIMERLGLYDRRELDMEAPVARTPQEFIRLHGRARVRRS